MKLRTKISQSKSSSMNQSLKSTKPKFSGYESKLDIYSFQSEVLKIYERTAPKRMMPDLLKNNLLEVSALSSVKSVTDIEYIWKR